jgi:hypothetical protein
MIRSVRIFAAAFAVGALLGAARPAQAALTSTERAVLVRYLDALAHERYDAAFALLSLPEQRYFASAKNFATSFAADRLHIDRYKVIGSSTVVGVGAVAVVMEHVRFFDHAKDAVGTLDANVRYGVVPGTHGPAIKDPFHPWHAVAPSGIETEKNGIRATVRKVSFFTGRVEVIVTFANYGTETVTVLPYGRTVLRDDAGRSYVPLATKLASLTDRTLYEGLRLVPSARYTGALTFATIDRFAPKSLGVTFGPVVADGGDGPFDLTIPSFDVRTRQ